MISWCCTDWLIDRRHCEAKWVGQVKLVQDKINTAVKGVADNEEITKVLDTSRKQVTQVVIIISHCTTLTVRDLLGPFVVIFPLTANVHVPTQVFF